MDYLVINFSLQIVRLQSIIYFPYVPLTNKIQTHSSTLIFHIEDIKMQNLLITAHSFKNRTFLTNHIQESYLPAWSSVLRPSNIFFWITYIYTLKFLFMILNFPRHIYLKSQTYRIRTLLKIRNDSKSFSINKWNINSTQYF